MKYLMAACALLVSFSCSRQETDLALSDGNTVPFILSVSREQMAKTTMDGTSVLWSASDQIGITCRNAGGDCVRADDSGGAWSIEDSGNYVPATTANFAITLAEGLTPIAAVYPYFNSGWEDVEDVISATNVVPTIQTAVKDNLPVNALAMVGKVENGGCVMHNVGAIIKFEITESNVTAIKLQGNNDEYISDRFYYNVESGELSRKTSYSQKYVTLKPSGDVFEAGEYYFVVSPVNFTKGFSITVGYSDGRETVRKTSSAFNIQRNHKYTGFGSDSGWFSDVVTGVAGNLGSASGATATLYGIAPETIGDGDSFGFQTSSDGSVWTDYAGPITERFSSDPVANVFTASLSGLTADTRYYYRAFYKKANGITTYGKAESFKTSASGQSAVIDLYNGYDDTYWPFTNLTLGNDIMKGSSSAALNPGVDMTLTTSSASSFVANNPVGVWLSSRGCLTMGKAVGDYIKFPVISGKKPVRVMAVVGGLGNETDLNANSNRMGEPSIRKVGANVDAAGGASIVPLPGLLNRILVWELTGTDADQYEMYFNYASNRYFKYLEVVYVDAGGKPAKIEQELLFSDGSNTSWPFTQDRGAYNTVTSPVGPFSTAANPDVQYSFYITNPSASSDNWRITGGQGLRYGGTAGDYMKIWPVADYKLTYIKIEGGNKAAKYSVKDATGAVVTGGTEQTAKTSHGSQLEFTLSGTTANTEYRLVLGSTTQSCIRKMWVTYELVQ